VTALAWLLRLGLGALLVTAGLGKLADPTAFAVEVANYRLLPGLAPYLAVTLPGVEIAIGLGLVLLPAPWRRAAALAATVLMGLFTVAVTQVVARGINVSCGCFGGESGPVTFYTVGRDLALLAASAWLLRLTPSGPPPSPPR
jgi:uncharacterized membrane protein YphA (DoxX/SURF4 family)